jgi:RNA polymerase sigma factor for flagellar operon FliA
MITANTAKSPAARRAYEERREALIKEFAPTIKYLASRLAVRLPSYLDAEDLFSVGLIGLLNAFDRYDPTREAKFKTYAEYRIRGAMLDEIRSMDWIPRSVRDRITLLQRTCEGLQKRLGRPPSEEEIGEAMGLNQEELSDFLTRSQGAFVLSLDDLDSHEPEPRMLLQCLADQQAKDPLAELVGASKRKQLAVAIEDLPQKERLVLTLYYYEELTMKEIGKVLSVTESRVSQLHSQALLRLKTTLKMDE